MSPEAVAAVIAAGAALAGAALGFAGSVAVPFVRERHRRKAWLQGKQSELYERVVAEIVRVAESKGSRPQEAVDLSSLKTFLYLFIRMYFAADVPYAERSRFFSQLEKYRAALQSNDSAKISDAQGELVNYLSDVARKPLRIPDAEFKV